ncbi:unnamed protein product [Closterium sp. Yama58-4]|nr:unnamed protein product [Closterium sp. Yama58-4]
MKPTRVPAERVDNIFFKKLGVEFRLASAKDVQDASRRGDGRPGSDGEDDSGGFGGDGLSLPPGGPRLAVSNKFGVSVLAGACGFYAAHTRDLLVVAMGYKRRAEAGDTFLDAPLYAGATAVRRYRQDGVTAVALAADELTLAVVAGARVALYSLPALVAPSPVLKTDEERWVCVALAAVAPAATRKLFRASPLPSLLHLPASLLNPSPTSPTSSNSLPLPRPPHAQALVAEGAACKAAEASGAAARMESPPAPLHTVNVAEGLQGAGRGGEGEEGARVAEWGWNPEVAGSFMVRTEGGVVLAGRVGQAGLKLVADGAAAGAVRCCEQPECLASVLLSQQSLSPFHPSPPPHPFSHHALSAAWSPFGMFLAVCSAVWFYEILRVEPLRHVRGGVLPGEVLSTQPKCFDLLLLSHTSLNLPPVSRVEPMRHVPFSVLHLSAPHLPLRPAAAALLALSPPAPSGRMPHRG